MTQWLNKREVLRRIRALPEAVKLKIKIGIADSAEELVHAMRNAAPHRTGDLAKAIIWEWGAVGKGSHGVAKNNEAFTVTIHIEQGFQRTVAPLVEFGVAPHVNEGRFPGTENPGFRPEPFFYPMYRAYKKRIKSRIRLALREGIKLSKGM